MRPDLNLLLVLDALLSEGSVTGAARRLNLAQPTVSNALARLREQLKDPLLRRAGKRMVPTQRALQLMVPLKDALSKIDLAVKGESAFDPRTVVRIIRIAATDYVSAVLLPVLMAHLAKHAPTLRLVVMDFNPSDPFDDLESGQVDMLLGAFSKASSSIHRLDLFTDDWVCATRKGHPTIHKRMSLKQFRDCVQVSVRPQHGSTGHTIDELLEQTGSQRNVTLSLPHLFSGIRVLLASDFVLTLAARVGAMVRREIPIQILDHPLRLKPFVVSLIWHDRTHLDPAHAWLRKTMAELAATERHVK
jgi:DNA-binding transcriptional LysR family regulator